MIKNDTIRHTVRKHTLPMLCALALCTATSQVPCLGKIPKWIKNFECSLEAGWTEPKSLKGDDYAIFQSALKGALSEMYKAQAAKGDNEDGLLYAFACGDETMYDAVYTLWHGPVRTTVDEDVQQGDSSDTIKSYSSSSPANTSRFDFPSQQVMGFFVLQSKVCQELSDRLENTPTNEANRFHWLKLLTKLQDPNCPDSFDFASTEEKLYQWLQCNKGQLKPYQESMKLLSKILASLQSIPLTTVTTHSWKLGLTLGYRFSLSKRFKIIPKIGIDTIYTRKFEIPILAINFEEKYLQIPVAVQLRGSYGGFTLGYQFDCLLSQSCQGIGLSEAMSTLPKRSGSIFWGYNFELGRGVALGFKVHAYSNGVKPAQEPEKKLLSIARAVSAPSLGVHIGLDLMKLFWGK